MAAPGPDLFRAALKERGISQNQAERLIGVAGGTASRWTSGDRIPSLEHALAIERELGVPVASWVEEEAKTGGEAA